MILTNALYKLQPVLSFLNANCSTIFICRHKQYYNLLIIIENAVIDHRNLICTEDFNIYCTSIPVINNNVCASIEEKPPNPVSCFSYPSPPVPYFLVDQLIMLPNVSILPIVQCCSIMFNECIRIYHWKFPLLNKIFLLLTPVPNFWISVN